MKKKYHVIINPSAGQPYPVLHTLSHIFSQYHIPFEASVTKKDNTKELTKQALEAGADTIIVYGGDGTVSEVASVLVNRDIPLGILPGGTANLFSLEIGIPQSIKKACRLIFGGKSMLKKVDVGRVGEHFSLLRLALGFEAEIVKATDRKRKSRMGLLAYALSSFKAALKTRPTRYKMILDGKTIERDGLSLLVANSANLGLAKVRLFPDINVSDGLLDVVLFRAADLKTLFSLREDDARWRDPFGIFQHWQVKRAFVSSSPQQSVQCDGEIFDHGNLDVEILPSSLNVIVPDRK